MEKRFFDFSLYFNNNTAQFPVNASESTYPSEVTEVEQSRVITEHTVNFTFTFKGSAQVPISQYQKKQYICGIFQRSMHHLQQLSPQLNRSLTTVSIGPYKSGDESTKVETSRNFLNDGLSYKNLLKLVRKTSKVLHRMVKTCEKIAGLCNSNILTLPSK